MKKILALVAAILMTFAVFAGGSREAKKVTLDFPTWQAEEGGFALFWKDMIKQFQETHPNVEINITQIPFSQFTDTLITRYSANDAPDITHIASRFFYQFASQGWFENLDPYFKGTGILEDWTALQSSMVYDKQNQGLLVLGYGFVMYYNEKILKDAGAKVPTNIAELRDAINKVNALGNPDINAYGVTTQQHANTYQDFANFVYGSGTSLIKDGKYNFSDPAVIQAAQDYSQASSFSPKGVSTEMLRQLFIDGKVAMLVDGTFVAALLNNADADIKPHLKLARPPFKNVPGTISNSLHISKSLPADKKALVFEFIKQVASPENQALYAQYTQSPCGLMSAASKITDANLQFINGLSADAVSIMPASELLMKNYSKYIDLCVTSILKMQNKDANVSQELQALQKNLTDAGLGL